jgi:hypothetical protein
MTVIAIFSDNIFFSHGLATFLHHQGCQVYIFNSIKEMRRLSVPHATLYLVAIDNFSFRQYVCRNLGDMRNVLHAFDIPEAGIGHLRFGYVSRRIALDKMWESVCRFIRQGGAAKVPLSAADIHLIRTLVDREDHPLQIARHLQITDKAVHGRKYLIMKKFGFDSSRPVNLLHCYTLISFRHGASSVFAPKITRCRLLEMPLA